MRSIHAMLWVMPRQPRRLDAGVEHVGRLGEPAAHEVRRSQRREQRGVQVAGGAAEPERPLGVRDRLVVAVQVRRGRARGRRRRRRGR